MYVICGHWLISSESRLSKAAFNSSYSCAIHLEPRQLNLTGGDREEVSSSCRLDVKAQRVSYSPLRLIDSDSSVVVIYSQRPFGLCCASQASEKSWDEERRANQRYGSWAYLTNMERSLIILIYIIMVGQKGDKLWHIIWVSHHSKEGQERVISPPFYLLFFLYLYLPSHNPNPMFRNSHTTFFESHESIPTGCCAHTFLPCRPTHLYNPSRIRVYSGRKIEVVSARKGHSQARETTPTNRSLNREAPQLGVKVQKKIVTTPRPTSSGRSYVEMGTKQEEKVQAGGLKISRVSTHQYAAQTRPSPRKETQPNSTKLPSFQYISQISLISEEFVSQGSAINIASLLAPPKNPHHPPPPSSIRVHTQLQPTHKNPIQRLMDRKRYEHRTDAKKKKITT